MRELGPATANPGDAHVKVGLERESASSETVAEVRLDRDRGLLITLFSAGALQNWPFIEDLGPKKKPIDRWDLPPKIDGFHCLIYNATQSDAQLLLTIAPRSVFTIYSNFASGPPKPSRNRPDTARVRSQYFLKGI